MKFVLRWFTAILCILVTASWGFYAHYRINHLAVFILPPAMSGFYKANINYITEHAVSPDKRRYVDSAEIPRHYFDADHYGKDPFHTVPQKWEDAAHKYSVDTLLKYGTLPWVIQENYYRLVGAFKRHDTTAILSTSAYLGHYVADACVPLHTTSNYNGQQTGQTGIHALWESRLPELFGQRYRLYSGKARYIENPLWQAFIICRSSYKGVDSVLRFERRLAATYPTEKRYETVKHGSRKVQDYSAAYSKAYQNSLNNMVERRMRMAVLWVGSFWYSAWVDAGQPDLNKLIEKPLTTAELVQFNTEQTAFKTGKPVGILTP
ncbi:hypothetical protein GCM10027037_34450 [Mucilaginibacter koreensis]